MNLQDEQCIYEFWLHSFEEDDMTKSVYRPLSFEFPPSMGREGIEIKKNGEIIFHIIGPDDTPQQIIGHFEIQAKNKLTIHFNDKESKIITILSCEKGLLVIQK